MHAGAQVVPIRESMPEGYIDKRRVAERLGMSVRWVEGQIARPDNPMPSYLIGGKRKFLWSEVEAWATQRPAPGGENP